jgi:hypothetical protein
MIFNHDWWFGAAFPDRVKEARRRCARGRLPNLPTAADENDPEFKAFFDQVEARTIIYLRDGFSYEVKEIIPLPGTSSLAFECMPADDAYKVGAFVVTVPFDEIVRVEVFAVHPREKPEDMPSIKGFSSAQAPHKRGDERPVRSESAE